MGDVGAVGAGRDAWWDDGWGDDGSDGAGDGCDAGCDGGCDDGWGAAAEGRNGCMMPRVDNVKPAASAGDAGTVSFSRTMQSRAARGRRPRCDDRVALALVSATVFRERSSEAGILEVMVRMIYYIYHGGRNTVHAEERAGKR
ncbi:hypothetical protein HLH32_12740 [Gluconacetobacter liquefaciens]|uniref:Uncharacterized protein n=1 Tax=Gluconacetobacter liquefaciens TaxID=89584 RepID=A0A7W4JMF4_GLULI|nr:hypothetical protein [Gluconacetobacter liquefaciens]